MSTKIKIASIDPNDPNFNKEKDSINIDMEVQRFDEDFSGVELPEDVNQKLIGYLEKLIRKSYEYKQYIAYLKDELDITKCALVPTLDIKDVNISLEFHHYPITLYDIVDTILRKKIITKKNPEDKVNLFDVMSDVMEEHYAGHVGLVPLSKTMHEMAHNGSVKIPATSVYGDIMTFITKYRNYMTPELLDKAQTALLVTEDDARRYNTKLEKTVIHYNVNYNETSEDNEE